MVDGLFAEQVQGSGFEGIDDRAFIQTPDIIKPMNKTGVFSKNMTFVMDPYSVVLIEISFK